MVIHTHINSYCYKFLACTNLSTRSGWFIKEKEIPSKGNTYPGLLVLWY